MQSGWLWLCLRLVAPAAQAGEQGDAQTGR
jgi:hypothetical protein